MSLICLRRTKIGGRIASPHDLQGPCKLRTFRSIWCSNRDTFWIEIILIADQLANGEDHQLLRIDSSWNINTHLFVLQEFVK